MNEIRFDATAITDDAQAAMEWMSANAWDETFSRCPRCGAWAHWQDCADDDGCDRCHGCIVIS